MSDEAVMILKECRDLLYKISEHGVSRDKLSLRKEMTFSKLATAYLDYSRSKVKPSTLSAYENLLIASPFAKSLSGRFVSELTRSTVQLWIDAFDEHTSYIHNFIIVMRSMISWARDRELCALPDEYTKPFRFKKMVRKGGGEEIDDADYDRILEYSTDNLANDRKYVAVFVALYTGMRIGELCGLMKDDIDAEKNIIHIRRTLSIISNIFNTSGNYPVVWCGNLRIIKIFLCYQ